MSQSAVFPVTQTYPCRGRGGGGVWLGLVIGLILLCAALGIRQGFESSAGTIRDRSELTYFPAGPWVRLMSLGFTELGADLAWLRAIQYYGEHRRTDQDYPFISNLFEALFLLDPKFENGYLFGALVLVEDQHDLQGALAMLERGMEANPESWRLIFEYGFFHYVHAKDPDQAAPYLAKAAAMPGAPEWVQRLAAYSAKKAGRHEMAVRLWFEIYRNTDNDEVRRIAVQYLAELGVPEFEELWRSLYEDSP